MKSCAIYLLSGVIFFSSLLAQAALEISPLPNNGVINLDAQSATINFSNPSTSAIPMSLSLSAAAGFSLSIDRCSGKSLAPKTTCYVVINVNDTLLSNGVNTAQLSNSSNLLLSVQRTRIQNSGSSLFSSSSSISINDFSSRSIVITNRTASTKSYSPILSGSDSSKFEISLNRCQSVSSGKTCTFSVRLKPQRAGSYSATISEPQISSSISLSSTITALTSGVVPEPVESISVSPSSLSFGTLTKFAVSQAQILTLTNTGNQVISPVVSVSSTVQIVTNRCAQLSPNQSCSVSVAMKPTYLTDLNGSLTGQVSVKSSVSASAQTVSLSSTLQVPPASLAYNNQGGTCPDGKHFENNVCVNDPVAPNVPANCQDILNQNPAAVNGNFDILVGSQQVNVYCDFSGGEGFIEVFDLNREPMLTDFDIASRLSRLSNISLTSSQIVRDQFGNIAWKNTSSDHGGVAGQSIGFEKILSSKLKFSARLGDGGNQGMLVLHENDQTGCNPDTDVLNSCYGNAYKNSTNQIMFLMADFSTGQTSLSVYDNGVFSNTFSTALFDFVLNNIPNSAFLTQSGRYESGIYREPPYIFFNKLLVKGFSLPKPSCAAAKLAGVSSGSVILDPDGTGPIPASSVYCDMSGSGVATVTSNCNNARLFGQKNVNNNSNSGAYLIDFTNSGSQSSAVNQYCDMSQTGWNNNEGGYTLVGIFDNNSTITPQTGIDSISSQNVYLNNSSYQSVFESAKEVILRSNRGDSSEVVFKMLKSSSSANCNPNSTSIVPSSFTPGSTATNTVNAAYWFWGEGDCNFSGGDYSMVGIRTEIGSYYSLFVLSNQYIKIYDWSSGTFTLSWPTEAPYTINGQYIHIPRGTNEPLYIFVK